MSGEDVDGAAATSKREEGMGSMKRQLSKGMELNVMGGQASGKRQVQDSMLGELNIYLGTEVWG